MTQPHDLVIRCFQMAVGHDDHLDLVPHFDPGDVRALFIQQISADIHRNLEMHCASPFLHRFFFENPQDMERG